MWLRIQGVPVCPPQLSVVSPPPGGAARTQPAHTYTQTPLLWPEGKCLAKPATEGRTQVPILLDWLGPSCPWAQPPPLTLAFCSPRGAPESRASGRKDTEFLQSFTKSPHGFCLHWGGLLVIGGTASGSLRGCCHQPEGLCQDIDWPPSTPPHPKNCPALPSEGHLGAPPRPQTQVCWLSGRDPIYMSLDTGLLTVKPFIIKAVSLKAWGVCGGLGVQVGRASAGSLLGSLETGTWLSPVTGHCRSRSDTNL